MAGHTYFGKQELCYTEVSDYTNYQGVGSDPLYKRYDSVRSVVSRCIPEQYQHFLATPEYLDDEDQICWHIDNWKEHPYRLKDLDGADRVKYEAIKQSTVAAYKGTINSLEGEDLQIMAGATRFIDDECIYCADGKVFLVAWGMTPDTKQHKVVGAVIHDYHHVEKFVIKFDAGEHGTFQSKLDRSATRAKGSVLSAKDAPMVISDNGWEFIEWTPVFVGTKLMSDMTFTAQYKKIVEPEPIPVVPEPVIPVPNTEPEPEIFFNCRFDAGSNGKLSGSSVVRKMAGTYLETNEIPGVTPKSGYEFKGWNMSPLNTAINGDTTFVAQYSTIPWYKRFWLWLTTLFAGKGCLRWLLWLLLFLLGLWLLSWLLSNCHGCTNTHTPVNGVVTIDTISTPDGRTIDDNGYIRPITGDDGKLPDGDGIVAPTIGEGGTEIPIIRQPGVPNTIGNRLFLFLEDENDDIDALAQDFKKSFPDENYSIIGFDKEVKLLVIQVPENEKDQIRKTINNKIPNHKFIVFDEEIYELHGSMRTTSENPGWHLNAIHLQEGWKITKGSSDVKVAVVDDGIQSSHQMFKSRIIDSYNVFTQDNRLGLGEGHGTHTAGLAVGNADSYSKGASGVAPNCMLIPIQVFDNKQCPLSALVAGVMYAIHHNADVVNISIGPSFSGLNQLPVEEQDQIAKQQFKNVERIWSRVCSLAAKKNTILVFAAGNDDILSSIPPENRNASAIVVAAVDSKLYPTDFTNYGPCSDISAPGKDIVSAYPNNSFKSFDGTSMAAPIVTGTIALMKSLKKDLSVTQAKNVLYKTGADVYGFIPPMVLVDKVLMGVKRNDFSKPKERALRPVPDGEGDKSSGVPNNPIVKEPVSLHQPIQSDETDYAAIRQKIADYKKKISDLEKLLPNK